MKTQNSQAILTIEDSDEDYFAMTRAFGKSNLDNPVYRCKDGDDALSYLFRQGRYADPKTSPRPGVILLDLNLPGTDGREVLQEIKKDAILKKLPVIVLTTSDDARDIDRCYAAGANSYIQKPVDIDRFIEAIRGLKDYWLEIVILPEINE